MAQMPTAWVDGLTQGKKWKPTPKAKASSQATEAWLSEQADGEPCEHLRSAITRAALWFAENGRDGAHDYMRDAIWGLVRDARAGHRGIRTALAVTQRAFVAEVRDRRSLAEAEGEWQRALDGAVAGVRADAVEPGEEDDCDLGLDTWQPGIEEPSDDAVEALLAEMLDFDALESIPEAEYLVKGLFDLDSLGQVFGQSGHRKSFVMLDISCHISLGLPWCGRRVRSGPVVYIAAEGERGIRKRLRAWAKHHGRRPNVLVLPRPVGADEWPVLVAALRRVEPVLVVGDTQARLTSGIDENSAKEIGVFIDRLDAIRRATGACVVVVHHEGLAVGRTRGSSAQKGALAHQFRVVTDSDTGQTVFSDEKQKDQETSGDLRFDPVVVSLGADSDGDPITSLVLVPASGLLSALDRVEEVKSKYQRKITDIVAEAPHLGLTKAEVRTQFAKDSDKRRFTAAWDALCKKEVIVPVGKTSRYRLAGIDGS